MLRASYTSCSSIGGGEKDKLAADDKSTGGTSRNGIKQIDRFSDIKEKLRNSLLPPKSTGTDGESVLDINTCAIIYYRVLF